MGKKYTLKKRGGGKSKPLHLINISNISKIFVDLISKYIEPSNKQILRTISEQYKLDTLSLSNFNPTTICAFNFCLINIYKIGNKYNSNQGGSQSPIGTPPPSRASSQSGSPPLSEKSQQFTPGNISRYLLFKISSIDIDTIQNIDDTHDENKFIKLNGFIPFTDDIVTANYDMLTNYVSYIYTYGIINYKNYDDLIVLYCCFCVFYSLSNKMDKKVTTWSSAPIHSNAPSSDDSYTIKPNIKKLLNPEKTLMINMIHAFNVLTKEVHNDLIYTFSPYNIFNKYLNEALTEKITNNIGIMQICILLYSDNYTPLQIEILDINLKEKNTFSNPLKLISIIDDKSARLVVEGDTILDKTESHKMVPIQNYIGFLKGLLDEPLITKYHDFLNKEQYLELAKTINRMYGLGILTF